MTDVETLDALRERVIEFVVKQTHVKRERVRLSSSLLGDLGVDGVDAVLLIEAFARAFNVDVTQFNYRKHFGPEGLDVLALFWRWTTGRRPTPILVSDLVEAARRNKLDSAASAS